MVLRNKNILIISPEPWDHIHVSKHHYAIELAKRKNKVYFLNPPSQTLSIRDTKFENLSVVTYQGFIRGLRYFPQALRKAYQRKVLSKLQDLIGAPFEIIWSFDNSVFYDMEIFGEQTLKISHIVDLNQDFQTRRAARSADICLGVIPKIVERLKTYNPRSYLVRHGLAVYDSIYNDEVNLPGRNSMKALYFGNMAMPHLDWQLIFKTIKVFKEVDFIFLGPNAKIREEMSKALENVFFLPPVSSEELMCYMLKSDILFLFYTREYLATYATPHKMMEYLSSGKPIISSLVEDYNENDDVILIAQNSEDWMTKFENLVRNYSFYNSKNLVQKRKSIALANTYEKQIMKIENLIK